MKRFYSILGLCAMFAMPTFAQEEDVTHLITNPGFDVDLTFLEDGTTKEIVETGSLSSRSHKHVAADGTIYARTKTSAEGNGNWKRNDTQYSFNGFLGKIEGWTLETGSNGEWTYFGAVPYSLVPGSTTVGIADDNNGSWLTVAGKPEEADTEDNKATMYLRAGWTNYAAYSQVVNLPCAQYRLEYWINNMNFASTDASGLENLCKIVCRKDVFPDEEGVNADGWTKHTIEFTPTSEFTITMGFKSGNYGSGKNPILLIDGLKLYKIGDADPVELLQADINDIIEQIREIEGDQLADFEGIMFDIEDQLSKFEDDAYSGDEEIMVAAYKAVQAYLVKVTQCAADVETLANAIEAASPILELGYPGEDALSAAIEAASAILGSDGSVDAVAEQIAALDKAVKEYYMSQEASEDNPADFSFIISQPKFGYIAEDGTPTGDQGTWYIGQDGGDQRLHTGLIDNEGNPMTAWNAWRNNLTSSAASVSISQDIEGLPNGKYTVTADMCTQDGCITDQHVFANGSASSAQSPVMTVTGWNPYVWETLTTATVIVVDGKLTIGAIGHGPAEAGDVPSNHGGSDTDARMGWFCVSNFKLNYLGEATAEEYAAAVAAKIEAAKAYAEGMHFAADKAALVEVANAASSVEDLDALNAALADAEASETEYVNILAGSYKDLKDRIAGEVEGVSYTADAKAIAQVVIDHMDNYIASAAATYKDTPAMTEIQRIYRDTVLPTLVKAQGMEISDATGKAALNNTIVDVVAGLKTYTNDQLVLNDYVAQLNEAMNIATLADIDYSDGSDVTAYMSDPAITSASPAGWTINKIVGDGSGAKSGQAKNGNSGDFYIDTYDATAGNVRASMYQVINVPNGTYKFSADMRNSGGGYYLFASTAAPTTDEEGNKILDASATNVLALAEAPITPSKYLPDSDEDVVKADTHGQYWIEAADILMNLYGVAGADKENLVSVYEIVLDKIGTGETTCPEGVDPAVWDIFSANGGNGRGWFNNSLEITVTDHTLCLGVTNDAVFTAGLKDNKGNETVPFTGSWFSANDFKLEMVKAGDNTGWNPATAIESVDFVPAAKVASVYTLSGARINGTKKGLNIVKYADGTVSKIFVK